ncbi:MAG: bifunctional (p)ppGpp synthetase/guanosine-3',5'-bis(diphosphate) 3'-pyrophosphohydrolase [Gracilibacteraceae bacterium]|jgi:GTP pyrophosphokinase|nr:bifunctional (p)ppGpp synthetase/guanosine-3',5'-bis(diphosphate) 3'-pyrophosphohydrolase [Gracilibacteraceae bacterium]
MTFAELRQKILAINDSHDLAAIEKAYQFAEKAHCGQLRNSGEEYIQHPMAVAAILCDMEMDDVSIMAAFLHDVAEDTEKTLEDIRQNFGPEVAQIVDGVTKLGKIAFRDKEEAQVENLRKMFLAMAKDIRVIIIKLADRLHNMRTLQYQREDKQREIAKETMDIYAPLANRLGIYRIKSELEDLSFRYLNPEAFAELSRTVESVKESRDAQIAEVIDLLGKRLFEVGVKAELSGRAKHLYSIYRKMQAQEKGLNEIFDLAAIRVIVDTVNDCYGALGVVHILWKPIPGKFKDYIAMPKPNMYQSLHTILAGKHGEPFEIQIRTWEMHHTAVYGVAAHWKYKEGRKAEADFEQKLSWLRQLLEWQHDSRDAGEFLESLKVDLFDDTVFAFTPKGDVLELPADSCLIDFAYRVHSDVGHNCIGAKVNGRIVPLESTLQNGDIVEIITSKTPTGPSRDWVCKVKTSQAKNRIRQWFRKEKREENITRGKDGLEREARKMGMDTAKDLKKENMLELVRLFRLNSLDDLYAALGDGAITFRRALLRLKDDIIKDEDDERPFVFVPGRTAGSGAHSQQVRVKGMANIGVRFSHCCNPLPGDGVIGYITRGRGVSVHKTVCPEIAALKKRGEDERLIEVEWTAKLETEDAVYPVNVDILAADRPALVTDVLNSLMETKTHVLNLNAQAERDGTAHIHLKIETRSVDHLSFLLGRIRRIKEVNSVSRV